MTPMMKAAFSAIPSELSAMAGLPVAILLFFLASATSSHLGAPSARIVGGTPAAIEDFPFMGSLQTINGGHMCGATIIASAWALTDAWCVLVPIYLPMYLIRVGTARQDFGGSAHTVTQWIHHPRADVERGDFDFALINVETPFPLGTPGVAAIALPTSGQPTPDAGAGVVAGWGRVSGSDEWTVSQLQSTSVYVFDDRACAVALGTNYTDRQLCAQNSGSALCSLDEGGPLVVDGTLLGVARYPGYPCADPTRIKGFARVAAVRDWIADVAGA